MKMNNKIKSINKLSLVISILISIIAWFYVVYNINPTMSRTYRDIPVTILGEDVLEENNLAVAFLDNEYIDIKLRAKRNILDKIENNSIAVSVDVSEAGKGDNKIAISIIPPSGTVLSKQSAKSVTVKVDSLKKRNLKIKTSVSGKLPSDEELDLTDIEEKTVEVKGAKSLVDTASYAEATVDVSKVDKSEKTISAKLVVKNASNKALKYVRCSPSKLKIKVVKSNNKKVKLNAIVNNPDSDLVERTYSAPDDIYIKGDKKSLQNIASIDTKTIDISNINKTTDIEMEYNLPNGIAISNKSKKMMLHVECTPLKTKTFNIDSESVRLKNIRDGLSTSTSGSVEVTIYGNNEELNRIQDSDIILSIDLSSFNAGTYSLTPEITSAGSARRSVVTGEISIKLY